MTKFIKKSKSEIGESPFEIKFRGKQKADSVLLRLIDYTANEIFETQLKEITELKPYTQSETATWLNMDGLHEPSMIEQIGKMLKLDRMVLTDILKTDQRPKIQEYDQCLFISMKMMQYKDDREEIDMENISIVLSRNLLVSFQEVRGDVFDPIRERLKKPNKKLRISGPDYLLFSLMDVIIDNYIYILSQLGDRIEELEAIILDAGSKEILEDIGGLKLELSFMRKNMAPAKELIFAIGKLDSELIDKEVTEILWQELQGNISLALETSDSYRDMLSDMMNIYQTNVNARLNDIMKFLTIFSAIFIPITFIAGVYGTNFDNVPELHYEYSYFIMLGVMIATVAGMVTYFKRKKWL